MRKSQNSGTHNEKAELNHDWTTAFTFDQANKGLPGTV